jgi:hypothetical protein
MEDGKMVQLVTVTIHNPMKAPRVIHGGESGGEPIRIEPNEVKHGVILLKSLAKTLQAQAERAGAGNEVTITIEGEHRVERQDRDDDDEGQGSQSRVAGETPDNGRASPTQRQMKRTPG